jgi:hypothetical protein
MNSPSGASPISTPALSILVPIFLPAAIASAGLEDGLMDATSNADPVDAFRLSATLTESAHQSNLARLRAIPSRLRNAMLPDIFV